MTTVEIEEIDDPKQRDSSFFNLHSSFFILGVASLASSLSSLSFSIRRRWSTVFFFRALLCLFWRVRGWSSTQHLPTYGFFPSSLLVVPCSLITFNHSCCPPASIEDARPPWLRQVEHRCTETGRWPKATFFHEDTSFTSADRRKVSSSFSASASTSPHLQGGPKT
jgi:hypothetical protein